LVAIGRAVKRARLSKGISQEGLAAEASIDRSYMGGIERGEHNITMISLSRIAGALEIAPSSLLRSAGL
jgi:transcriptional regulator with XRE-family HTH domain